MNIAPSGHSAKQEKKVANKLYETIIVVVIITALCLITYGMFNKHMIFPNDPEIKQKQQQKEIPGQGEGQSESL